MKKTIQIGNKKEEFTTGAGSLYRYKHEFKTDMMKDLMQLADEETGDVDVALTAQVAFAMSKSCRNGQTFETWLDSFDMVDFVESIPEVIELIADGNKQLAVNESKNAIPIERSQQH